MGGKGSGRFWRDDAKDTVESRHSIDIRDWQREGLFKPDCYLRGVFIQRNGIWIRLETDHARLSYRCRTNESGSQELDYSVRLDTTPCHYGGERHWFRCPAVGCGRRVAKLYLGQRHFVCRHCLQLAYQSQREAPHERMARRANKLREQLGWEPGFLNGWGGKPKGMHQRTFERLSTEAVDAGHKSLVHCG
jgi:hypothetical protein